MAAILAWQLTPVSVMPLVTISTIIIASLKLSISINNFLRVLLTLEFVSLRIFVWILAALVIAPLNSALFFSILVLMVCEASLGLSLLVSLGRTKGRDLVSSEA